MLRGEDRCVTTLITAAKETIDNKDWNQISEPSAFRENMGLVGVPILAGSQTWFQSLLFKDFHFRYDWSIVSKLSKPL